MMMLFAFICALAAVSSAAPTLPGKPIVHLRNGTLIGSTTRGIENFFGIPFAKPPVRNLRLRPPQSLDHQFGTLTLPETVQGVRACTQMNITVTDLDGIVPEEYQSVTNGIGGRVSGTPGEDCLTVNVQRPANLDPHKKYPVLVWIYGGGFEIGATQMYDGSQIVGLSANMSEPVVFVAANYRLNAFGFLQEKELQEEGSTNLGLRDQRKALEWVAENIEAFGGDPDRVTIWGESAGALSVFDHLIINDGDHRYHGKPLFHAAIMNSGTFIPTLDATSSKAQDVFDTFASNAGCKAANSKHGSAILNCLRSVPYETYTRAMNSLPNYGMASSNNISYVRRPDTTSNFYSRNGDAALRSGKYANVPIIMGNMEDEASIFTPAQRGIINSTETLIDYFASWWPLAPRKAVAEFIKSYPDDPSAGLPARTGDKYEFYSQRKRNAAIQSDIVFGLGRRLALSLMATHVPAWSFLDTYLHDLPYWGTYHTADLRAQFGLQGPTKFAAMKQDEAYIHFVNFRDPNGERGCKEWWPKWDGEDLFMANFSESAVGIMRDTYRWKSYEVWKKYVEVFKQ